MQFATPAERSPIPQAEAPRDCPLCPRLVAFREQCRAEHPDWWNAPVPAFGDPKAWLAIVGLAPGKQGANRTGRPFTGDFAGDLLYATLAKFGLAEGEYRADPADGLRLTGAIILNAVKCLPPANKPEPGEIRTCRNYLEAGSRRCRRCGWWSRSARSPMSPRRGRWRCRRRARGSATAPKRSRRTGACCCRAIIARATTRNPPAGCGDVRKRVRAGAGAARWLRRS